MSEENNGADTPEKLKERILFLESESKKAFEERDKAKRDAAEFERLKTVESDFKKIKDAELEKNNEFKTLAENAKAELETANKKLAELEPLKNQLEEKLTAVETARKTELIEQLDDSYKDFAKDLSIDKLTDFVKLHKKVETTNGKPGQMTFTTEGKKWEDFSTAELEEIAKKSKTLFDKLNKERLKKLN